MMKHSLRHFLLPGRRWLLLALAACIIAAPLRAQDDEYYRYPSKVDIFAGYSYYMRITDTYQTYGFHTMPYGVIGQGAYFFKPWLGVDAGASYQMNYKYNQIYFVQGGPVFRYSSRNNGLSVFAHGVLGGVNISGPNIPATTSPLTYTFYNPPTWGQAYGAGIGMDYNTPLFHHHVAVRLFQADYESVKVNYGPVTATGGGIVEFDSARLSAGLVWQFGGGPAREKAAPLPPMGPGGPSLACSASPMTVASGDRVSVSAVPSGFDPRYSIAYAWTASAGRLMGADTTVNVDTRGLPAGTYSVAVHATSGKQVADCSSSFTVAAPQPPTISCTASPAIVTPGQQVTITAQGYSPNGRPLTYSFRTAGGTASGAGNSATLATTGLSAGTVTVYCDVADDMNRTAETTASFAVNSPAPPPQAAHTEPLCDISFARDRARPTRVDNEAKACLDSVALAAQREPDATVIVVGDAAPTELGGNMVAAQRAVNTKDYLVTEKGLDAARVEARTGGSGGKVVQTFLVPSGADFETDYSGSIAVDAGIVPQARVPLTRSYRSTPVRRRRRVVHRTVPKPAASGPAVATPPTQ